MIAESEILKMKESGDNTITKEDIESMLGKDLGDEEDKKIEYPTCVKSEGLGPVQYGSQGIIDSRLAEMEEKYDLQPDAMRDGYGEEGDEDTSDDSNESEDDSFADASGDDY